MSVVLPSNMKNDFPRLVVTFDEFPVGIRLEFPPQKKCGHLDVYYAFVT